MPYFKHSEIIRTVPLPHASINPALKNVVELSGLKGREAGFFFRKGIKMSFRKRGSEDLAKIWVN